MRGKRDETETGAVADRLGQAAVAFFDLRADAPSGFLQGRFHYPCGRAEFWIDPESPCFKPVFGAAKRFVFRSASGGRAAPTVGMLHDIGFQAAHLKDGLSGWGAEGGPVVFAGAPPA